MFTGIIEELGKVKSIKHGSASAVLTIESQKVLEDANLGDSIAVDGVCLTITSYNKLSFTVDVMFETLRSTSLARLKPGSLVNLERALSLGERFGGHIVSGHIDGVGVIKDKKKMDIATLFTVQAPQEILKYVVKKGSIAVDGISLTVVDLTKNDFKVSIIPHTAKETTLNIKQVGDIVNLETDMLAKYVEKFLNIFFNQSSSSNNKQGLTMDFLNRYGFV